MDNSKKHNKKLTPRAIMLRKNMTPPERHLWYDFLCAYPIRFLRQKVIGNFIVDFYCAKAHLVIELDGAQHFTPDALAYDGMRTRHLEGFGLYVLRFTNYEVKTQFYAVCEKIDATVRSRIKQ